MSKPDIEAPGEQTPLLVKDDDGVLKEMKAESLKEKTVASVAVVSCKYDFSVARAVDSLSMHKGLTVV